MKSLFNKIYRFLFAIPFGLKGADKEILGNGDNSNVGNDVVQTVDEERLSEDLMKGEVTQEVEDLRYRTYAVSDASKGYEYIGDGFAVRKNGKKKNLDKFKFTQRCHLQCSSVLDELNRLDGYGVDNYTLNILYNNEFVKFRLEKYVIYIDVDVNKDEEYYMTTLRFDTIQNPYDENSMPFINALKELEYGIRSADNKGEYIKRNEIASSMEALTFVTINASNDFPDMVVFTFVSPSLIWAKIDGNEFKMAFKWKSVQMENLMEKYFSSNMAMKYEQHLPKVEPNNVVPMNRKVYCSECGKEMSVYDGDITKYDFGRTICPECLKKIIGE